MIDGTIVTKRTQALFGDKHGADWLRDEAQRLSPESIAKTYHFLHEQGPDAWTLEMDLRYVSLRVGSEPTAMTVTLAETPRWSLPPSTFRAYSGPRRRSSDRPKLVARACGAVRSVARGCNLSSRYIFGVGAPLERVGGRGNEWTGCPVGEKRQDGRQSSSKRRGEARRGALLTGRLNGLPPGRRG